MFAKEENQNSAAHHTDTSRPRVRIRRSSEYLATSIPIAALEAQRGFATSAEEREVLMLELETPGTGQCCEEITFDFHLRLATVHSCRAEGPDRDAVTGRREIAISKVNTSGYGLVPTVTERPGGRPVLLC